MMTLTEYLKREDEDDPSLYEDEMDCGEEVFVDGNLVYLDGRKFVSEADNITVRTGVWCEQDENGEWEPDWAITLLHANDKGPEDYLYFENGSIQSTLHNYFTHEGQHLNTDHFVEDFVKEEDGRD